jgi:hypothetical protein
MFRFFAWGGLLALLALAGCGNTAQLVEFARGASQARDLNTRVAEMANTTFDTMPDAGSVNYIGNAGVVYSRNGRDVTLLGTATVTANFADQMIAGRIEQMSGGTGASDLRDYAGELTIAGQIGVRRPNSFDVMLGGTLTGAGQTIVLSGPLRGDFRGSEAQAIVAISNGQMHGTVNGADAPVRVRLTAER